ncbi:MAG: sialate O-acetylesterase [Planctomyces sp.]
MQHRHQQLPWYRRFVWSLLPLLLLVGVAAVTSPTLHAEEKTSRLQVSHPQPWQVLQRHFTPAEPTQKKPASLGSAEIQVHLSTTDDQAKHVPDAEIRGEFRIVPVSVANPAIKSTADPADLPWQSLSIRSAPAHNNPPRQDLTGTLTIPAGGWYRLDFRLLLPGKSPLLAAVEPVAVGEVFLIAGQSYATNTNDEVLQVRDPQLRVSAYDWETGKWRLANDPQPAPDRSTGGSIWPPVGDLLARHLHVPIGFANVAVGGTSTRQWLPAEPLSVRLQQVGQKLGAFRAVLWQQGESDVIENTPTADYIARLQQIRAAAVAAWQISPPWFCALSTHHPTVYNRPESENRIREALLQLSRQPGFALGPDTDKLQGENRGGPQSRRHFSAPGQRNAARLWADTLLLYLQSQAATPASPQP